jgi:hypothetical protein
LEAKLAEAAAAAAAKVEQTKAPSPREVETHNVEYNWPLDSYLWHFLVRKSLAARCLVTAVLRFLVPRNSRRPPLEAKAATPKGIGHFFSFIFLFRTS